MYSVVPYKGNGFFGYDAILRDDIERLPQRDIKELLLNKGGKSNQYIKVKIRTVRDEKTIKYVLYIYIYILFKNT